MLGLGSKDGYWGVHALDFVDKVERVRTHSEVTALFRNAIAGCGFHAFIMAGLPVADTKLQDHVLANGWPSGWSELYVREQWDRYDPVPRHCFRTVEPFEWSEAPFDAEAEPMAQAVMHRALDFRMTKGFCVPIHYGDGFGAAVSIGGERPDFGGGAKPAIHLMALYAHHKIRSLLLPPRAQRAQVLTNREREVLRWTAVGKTSWEIGSILAISERTANAHISSAARKLNAVNRTATVVAALRRREIDL